MRKQWGRTEAKRRNNNKKFDKLLQSPKTFHNLTGLTPTQFQQLVAQVEPLFWQDDARLRAKRSNRKRKTGAGRQFELTVAEMLFMLLLYYRTYITHVFLGFLMDIEGSNIWSYFKRLEPILTRVFKTPERRMELNEEAVWELIVDATEQKAYRRKGTGYSGKKKDYTLKTQFIVSRDRRVMSISKTVPGQCSDKKLYDQTHAYVTQENITRHQKDGPPPRLKDLGYVGTGGLLPHKHKPHKKGTDKIHFTKEEKAWNQLFSSNRIVVEHVFSFSGIKKFQILRSTYRNPIHRYHVTIKNIAGLHNFVLDNPSG